MLGARITVLRREAGMSQAELARRLCISPSAVGMYEQGRREPAVETLIAMAEIFGVSMDYLLTGKPQSSAQEPPAAEPLLQSLEKADRRPDRRGSRHFSRQELAVLFAAMLMEA